ncbi:MAG TPA: HlyD family efflux transporter periplasmic adaptor subunit [Solirubrobacteraceae bacterium]|jgi:multidrug efflux pump subunit AcrA (membrane-fusion protein)|nr:HlyD family efflux transporter periplasmic adaptor subunit [Solirubrobacteraceae bacterium]
MSERVRPSWIVYGLATLLAAAIAAAVLVVGPAAGQSSTQTRTVTAQRGVVQSTVSGSGSVEPSSQLDLGFKTSGTVTKIDVTQGEQVGEGQLLATLDPQSAEVTLEQAKAGLQSAEAALAREEETDGESSSSSQSTAADSTGSRTQTATAAIAATSAPVTDTSTAGNPATSTPAASTPTTSTPTSTSTSTAPTAEAPAPTMKSSKRQSGKGTTTGSGKEESSRQAAPTTTSSSNASSTSSTSEVSTATRAANIASARAAVKSDRLTVQSAEQSVADTRLLAPESGTIVSLEGEVGETVSGGGTSRASSEAGESSGSGTGLGSGGTGSSSSSSSSSDSSGGSFAVLSDLGSMKLVVPLSESEVGSVKRGQPATVTIEALKGIKLAAHVSEVAALPTSNSGVVSYDVTFQLDQLHAGLKAGMSATAEVVVAQAEGVNVPSSAISGGTVTVVEGAEQVPRAVTTGLAGDSTTIVLSGLNAGQRVALPLTSTSSATSSLLSRLAGRSGASALGGGLTRGATGAGAGAGGFGGGFARGGGPGG